MKAKEHPYRLEVWYLRTKELTWEAEEARLAKGLRDTRPKKGGSKTTAALGLLAALLAAGLMLLSGASPAHAATTFTVTNASDPGDGSCFSECTLRDAILAANLNQNDSETDSIRFDISGTGPHTIRLTKPLPEITEPVVIDGYTQHGASPNTLSKGTNAKIMIELDGSDTEFDTSSSHNGLQVRAPNTVIKGLAINGFRGRGIWVIATSTPGVRLEGNFIGTDPTGTRDLGNMLAGVEIFGGSGSTVGGTTPAARNLISGNDQSGILVGRSSHNRIFGNLIGTTRDGVSPLGNTGFGVVVSSEFVQEPATDNFVGSLAARSGNTIAFNGRDGVAIFNHAIGNAVMSNSISSNGGLGIDLMGLNETILSDFSNPNDTSDFDSGPNDLLNRPVITSATTTSTRTVIRGQFSSTPLKLFTLQFFKNPRGAEGRTLIFAEKIIATDSEGQSNFSVRLEKGLKGTITATATDTKSNTSEFSTPKKVVRR